MQDLHVKVPVTDQLVSNIFETALHDSIDYWCEEIGVASVKVNGETRIQSLSVREEDEDLTIIVTASMVVEAIQKLLEGEVKVNNEIKSSIYKAVTENDAGYIDATAADVIVQVAAFNEIVYG